MPPRFPDAYPSRGAVRLASVECGGFGLHRKLRWKKENQMKRTLVVVGVAAAVMVGWSVGRVQGQNEMKEVVYVSSDQANYMTRVKGVAMAKIWGDADKGAHATFTKFDPGQDSGMHIHTNDVWIVVIKGAYLYKDDAGEKRVGPGDFLRVPGGHKHWSGGDAKEGAVFYEESSGKFDLIPVK